MITISRNLSELSDYYEKYNKISQYRNINQSSIQFSKINKRTIKGKPDTNNIIPTSNINVTPYIFQLQVLCV